MKLFQKIVIYFIFFITVNFNLYSQLEFDGDFCFQNGSSQVMHIEMKIVSVPFEGLTRLNNLNIPFNRYNNIQSGNIWKFFNFNSGLGRIDTIKYDLGFIKKSSSNYTLIDLGHCTGLEFPHSGIDAAWGFAKYQITVIVGDYHTGTKYTFYLNCLDSKYQQQLTPYDLYGIDFYVTYENTHPYNDKLKFWGLNYQYGHKDFGRIAPSDTIAGGLPSQEFKVWEMLRDSSTPLGKEFFARSTPFPITPIALDSHFVNRMILGTKVILDTVFYNFGNSDRWGYNTVIDPQNYYDYYYNPPIIDASNNNKLGETFTTPAWNYRDEWGLDYPWFTFNIQSYDTLILKKNKNFWISGPSQGSASGGDTLLLSLNSCIIKEENAQINLCYKGVLVDSGCNSMWSYGSITKVFEYSALNFLNTNHQINNGGKITIKANGQLNLGNNAIVTFDGAGSALELEPGAITHFGNNSKLRFINGAKLIANGVTFAGTNGATWQGIEAENIGNGFSITNCTFNNATAPLNIQNTEINENSLTLLNNTFNYTSGMVNAIYGVNILYLNIQNNNFNMSSGTGIKIFNRVFNGNPGNFNPQISHNTFNGGQINIYLNCNASASLPFSVTYNYMNASIYNIYGGKIYGDISYNYLISQNGNGIYLSESTPDILSNTIYSNNHNLNLTYSYPQIAPLLTESSIYWKGGKNLINTSQGDNIYGSSANPKLYAGQNCFYIGTYNFSGVYAIKGCALDARGNIFNNYHGIPVSNAICEQWNSALDILYDNNYLVQCNISTDDGEVWLIEDNGNGNYDTIYYTPNTSGNIVTEEDNIEILAEKNYIEKNYNLSKEKNKLIINNYPEGKYLLKALNDLYLVYEKLDISNEQTIRTALYGELKSYLEDKINSNLYSNDFVDNAFRIILKCETNMNNYSDASDGYEFVSLNHPSAQMRIIASWDYNVIQELSGQSGSGKEISENKYLEEKTKYFAKKYSSDPILQKVRTVYTNQKTEQLKSETDRKVIEAGENADRKQIVNELKKQDDMITSKVISNNISAKYKSKEEKRNRQDEDIMYILNMTMKSEKKDNQNPMIPKSFSLSQNYPNPFNPITKINYDLPKNTFVSLKIYDIAGREIKTLVNETKQAGSYTIDFNGSQLSSGVYFYRIQAGDFISVKRMVLIK